MSRKNVPAAQITKKVTTSSVPTTSTPVQHTTALDSTGQVQDEKVLVVNNNGLSD